MCEALLRLSIKSVASGAVRMRRPLSVTSPFDRSVFCGYRFPPEVILLVVRWYLRYGLSYRDVDNSLPNEASKPITSPSTDGCIDSHRC